MYGSASQPEGLIWPAVQGPVVFAVRRALAVSFLAFIDQLAELIWCSSSHASQVAVAAGSRPPFPDASQVPHSVTKRATPRDIAASALARSAAPWVWA